MCGGHLEARRPRRSRAIANQSAEEPRLPLRELEPLPRSRPSVLLPLDGARVAGQESRLLQVRAELRILLPPGPAEALAEEVGLAGEAATADGGPVDHVPRLLRPVLR